MMNLWDYVREEPDIASLPVKLEKPLDEGLVDDSASFPDPEDGLLEECLWSRSVALDPKHRPQTWDKPSGTVRRQWCRYPQEAHILDEKKGRYRQLSVDEIARIQGFEPSWFEIPGMSRRSRIKAIGDAVPPPLAKAVFKAIDSVWEWHNRTAIEICAGSGGLASGSLCIDNMKHLLLIDQWKSACDILQFHKPWPTDRVLCTNVKGFDFSPFGGKIGILSGGPPCQPWSQAGLHKGFFDPRDVLAQIHEIVGLVEPEVFVFENVPGLVSEQNKGYLHAVLDRLRAPPGTNSRYGVIAGILNAADFGLPQKRRRIFILGLRDSPTSLTHRVFDRIYAQATHREPSKPHATRKRWITLREALGTIPDPGGWRKWINNDDNGIKVGSDGAM